MIANKLPYGGDFFAEMVDGTRAARRVAPVIVSMFAPQSVVDVGCGIGQWLVPFQEAGADILGVDGDYVERSKLMIPQEKFRAIDLASRFSLGRTFDLAMSLEVGEHLPADVARQFVESLTALAPVVLFSAAVPGQGGTHHINEQWPSYWIGHFNDFGFECFDVLRFRFWDDEEVGACYRQNMLLFVRAGQASNYHGLISEAARQPKLPLSIVHPGVFAHALARPRTLRPLLQEVPRALWTAIRSRIVAMSAAKKNTV
jgi:SAM-dependent methyltransferase